VAAELALGISVGGEGLVAGSACEVVEALGRLFDQELVGAPPFLAAGVGTEDLLLTLGNLDDLFAALLACAFCWLGRSSGKAFPGSSKAQGFDSPLFKGEAGGNMAVGAAEAAHLKDLGFLVLCHRVLLPDAGKPYPFVCVMHREMLYRSVISSSWMRAHRSALSSFRMQRGI
jgi:hypothetical protein